MTTAQLDRLDASLDVLHEHAQLPDPTPDGFRARLIQAKAREAEAQRLLAVRALEREA